VEPFEEGAFLMVKWIDGSERNAEVIDRRQEKDGSFKFYYVHFTDFNRRMDDWVRRELITGPGKKVDPAHEEKQEGSRDELTMAGSGGSGAMSIPGPGGGSPQKRERSASIGGAGDVIKSPVAEGAGNSQEYSAAGHDDHEVRDSAPNGTVN
jgi:hypothetical protein